MSKRHQRDRDFRFPVQLIAWGDRYTCPLPVKLNPYRGCEHNCRYCYLYRSRRVKGVPEHRVDAARLEDIKRVFNEVGDGEHQSYLHQCIEQRIPAQIGTSTDPFQPIEKKAQITKQTLEFLNEIDYKFMLITKGIVPESYFDLIGDNPIQTTIITSDINISYKLEPNAPTPNERIENIREMADVGINTQLRLWPIFPNLTDQTTYLIDKVREAGAKDVIASFIRLFKYQDFKERINKALGYDYYKTLFESNYPIIRENDFYRVPFEKQEEEFYRIKREAQGMGFWTPTILHFNNFRCCCGTEDYLGKHAPWALKTRINKINHHTTYNEYMDGCNCPFEHQFKRTWEKGKICKSFSDIIYNKVSNTYSRKPTGKHRSLFDV